MATAQSNAVHRQVRQSRRLWATGSRLIEDAFADRDRTRLVDATRETPAPVVAIKAGER